MRYDIGLVLLLLIAVAAALVGTWAYRRTRRRRHAEQRGERIDIVRRER